MIVPKKEALKQATKDVGHKILFKIWEYAIDKNCLPIIYYSALANLYLGAW